MDEHTNEVEAHLLKETAATAAAAGALFGAGSAQARPIDPDPGNDARATLIQQVPAKPAKTHKKADHHQRQRNRADTMEP